MGKGKVKQALQLAGSQHKYQKILTLLICLLWIVINCIMIGPTLIYIDPVFHCNSKGDQRVLQEQACKIIQQCKLIDNFTLTSKLKLYCDLQWARDIIQSIFSIGSFVGLIVMNLISDTKGRKLSIMIALLITSIGIISTIFGGYLQYIPLLVFAQFLCGFGSYSGASLGYILLSDFCSDSFRAKAVVIINSAWGVATTSLGIYYLFKINWQIFIIVITLLPFICMSIAKYIFILQSPYILVNQNKKQKALQVLIKIAKINKRQQNIPQITKIIQEQQLRNQQNQASFQNVIKIVKQWIYAKQIILLIIIYGIGNLNFYSISFAFDMQGLGFGYNSIIAGFVQMCSFIYLTWFVNSIPRKKGITIFYSICASIGLSFLIPVVRNSPIAQTCLLGTSRIFGTIAYTLVECMQVQAFTVQIQSTAAGLIQAFSLYGVLLAPLLVDSSDKIGIDPIALVSIILIFNSVPTYFLRQTLVKKMDLNPEQQQFQKSLISSKAQEQNQAQYYQTYINSSSNKSLPTNDDQ